MTIYDRLDQYQRDAVAFCANRSGSAVFAEQGTGKTWITAGLVEMLAMSNTPMLLVVPLANIETTWARLLATMDCIHVYRDWPAFKRRTLDRAPVLLVHYEGLPKLIKKIRAFPWALIVYDESQRLKARGSRQSRTAARFVSHPGQRRVILSGTPVEQAPQDLWAQFRFAMPDVLGKTWSDFAGRWLKPTGYMGYKLEFRHHLMAKFLAVIAPHVLRITKAEVLDLPPLRIVRAPVEMLGEQRRLYDDLEDGVATMAGQSITCDMEVVRLVRQQQVTGGFVRCDPTEQEYRAALVEDRKPAGAIVYVGSAKSRRLARILRRHLEEPVVIFCKYREELVQIQKALVGRRVGVISGKTKKTRTAVVDFFQAGELDVLVCQIRAGGVGLDLFRSSVAVFYSCTFSYIDFWQAIARLHRRGQTREVVAYLLQAQDTVDNDIWSALVTKTSVTKTVLDSTPRKMRPMAKTEKKPEAATEKKKPTPPKAEKHAYSVDQLAEALGVKSASVRVQLRKAKIPKNGKTYGWTNEKDFQKVVKQLQAAKTEKKPKKEAETEEDEDEE